MSLTFSECKTVTPIGGINCGNESTGNITTTELSFQLATLPDEKPGVLIKPVSGEHFATFTCSFLNFNVTGNGLIGRIESPACKASTTVSSIIFEGTHGNQTYKTLKGTTTTTIDLKVGATTAAQHGTVLVDFNGVNTKLECT